MQRRGALRWLLSTALVLAGVYALATGSVAYAIAHAPNSNRGDALGVDVPDVEIDGQRVEAVSARVGPPEATISAWMIDPPSAARGTVVVLHGVRLDKRSMLGVARELGASGYRVLLVDLRGHGASSGQYLTYGLTEARDVSQLLDALEARGAQLGPVGVHGFSYGGATALHLAATDARVRAVVAVSSFGSLRRAVRDYVRWQLPGLEPAVPDLFLDSAVDFGAGWAGFDPDAAAPAKAAAASSAAVLIVHGSDDAQVSPDNARDIEQATHGRARLLLLSGETHATVLADPSHRVRAAAVAWFEVHLGGQPGPG